MCVQNLEFLPPKLFIQESVDVLSSNHDESHFLASCGGAIEAGIIVDGVCLFSPGAPETIDHQKTDNEVLYVRIQGRWRERLPDITGAIELREDAIER